MIRMRTTVPFPVALVLVVALAGCITKPQNPSATQPATAQDLATTQPSHWLDQPAPAGARADDFQRLWTAAEDVARDFLFRLDRQDYRAGVLTTRPMVSAQWFEPWRREVRTVEDRNESSLATVRRTIRFEFERLEDGAYRVTPKVLVERQALAEQRITSAVGYRQYFRRPIRPQDRPRGTRESDVGIYLPNRYWYPIGRDDAFERALAQAVAKKVEKART
jgi:hypothetical protein